MSYRKHGRSNQIELDEYDLIDMGLYYESEKDLAQEYLKKRKTRCKSGIVYDKCVKYVKCVIGHKTFYIKREPQPQPQPLEEIESIESIESIE